jgi:hypothetical protein
LYPAPGCKRSKACRCGDIAEQLPPEAKRFFPSIDKGFLKVTSKAFEEPVSF